MIYSLARCSKHSSKYLLLYLTDKKKCIHIWNNKRVSKWWQMFLWTIESFMYKIYIWCKCWLLLLGCQQHPPPEGVPWWFPSMMGLRKYVFALQFVIQCVQLPFCIWAKHILVTSSSIFGDSSRNGEAGGCCQQHRYISVVVMYGRSSVSLLSSPSGCRSACLDDFATFVFSGVSLFRRSRWHGDVPPVSSFWGVTLEDFPLDLCIFASNKFNFLGRIFLQVTSVKQKHEKTEQVKNIK